MNKTSSIQSSAIMEQAQQSMGEWIRVFQCSTHLLLNQWGINVDEGWLSYKEDDNNSDVSVGVNEKADSMAKQLVEEQMKKQQRQTSFQFSRLFRRDDEIWQCVMSGMSVTSMV